MNEVTVRADMTLSVDGFIAGPDADKPPYLTDGFFRVVHWVTKYMDPSVEPPTGPEAEYVAERIERTGAYILGRRMYDSAGDGWDVESPYKTDVFVVTHRAQDPIELKDGTTFHFFTEGVPAAIQHAKAVVAARGEGKQVHVSGGASTVQQALAAGLVDELHLHIAPVLLGQGTRLFDNLPYGIVELDRYRVVDAADATHFSFRLPAAQKG